MCTSASAGEAELPAPTLPRLGLGGLQVAQVDANGNGNGNGKGNAMKLILFMRSLSEQELAGR